MIYTRLNGGLGNQLFQYAAGVSLANRLKAGLILDARIYDKAGLRGYELGHFKITGRVGSGSLLPPGRDKPLGYLFWRYARRNPKIFRERVLGFNNEFPSLQDETYLHGYWQSERYFASHAAELRKEFEFVSKATGVNAELLNRISQSHSVSLHVRRGDYVSKSGGATHGTCTPGYYSRAVETIAGRLGQAFTLFIFSDDPNWARANLAFSQPTIIVDANDASKGFEDLRLMSACRHHIVANSSFSWWGAWLNARPDKIVIAPERWYANPEMKNPDICPANWLKVSGN